MNRSRKAFGAVAPLAMAWALGLLLPLACSDSGLVGGECAEGYTFCEPACVDLSSDERHCGACDEDCRTGESCVAGVCSLESGSGGSSGGAGGEGGTPGGGGASSGAGGLGTGGEALCLPPYDSSRYCGDCDTRCLFPTPFCGPDGLGSYGCQSRCDEAPFDTACSESCVDITSDADHCGGCDVVCPSGICVSGACVGTTPGHLVALCHDYSLYYPNAAQSTLLGNAVFMTEQSPVRILAYTEFAPSGLRTSTNAVLANQAARKARTFELTNENSGSALVGLLDRENFDVLLVYDQSSAPGGVLGPLATNLGPVVQTFTEAGGVVVVTTGGGTTSEMDDFLSALGLVAVTDFIDRGSERLYVQAPSNALALAVVSPYLGIDGTCSMVTSDLPTGTTAFVVTDTNPVDGLGAPVAVHRVVPPP